MIVFTLYSRSYCHLCEDMHRALAELVADVPHRIVVIDVDSNPLLVDRYDELVPVLFATRQVDAGTEDVGTELCHYHLDHQKVRTFCHE